MNQMSEWNYRIRSANHIGRQHLLAFRNNQDALNVLVNGQQYVGGVICDGCSEGPKSEVGAQLCAQFLIREMHNLLRHRIELDVVTTLLYDNMLSFIRNQLNSYHFTSDNDFNLFIRDHWLFTVVGFILTPTQGRVFYAGDGTIVINDQVTFIDQQNKPLYPSYHLIKKGGLKISTPLPTHFEIIPVDPSTVTRLAIGSDAWQQEPELLQNIWNCVKPVELQRRVNVLSRVNHKFGDDVSIITYETVEPDTEAPDDTALLAEAETPTAEDTQPASKAVVIA